MKKVEKSFRMSEFYIRLEDLNDIELFNLYKKNIDDFLNRFRKAIFKYLEFNTIIKNIFEGRGIDFEELHIIIDPINYDFSVAKLDDFSENWSYNINKFVRVKACYMTMGLEKKVYHKSIEYFCDLHNTNTTKNYPFGKLFDEFEKPKGCLSFKKCINPKMEPKKYHSYEVGFFTIGDSNFTRKQLFKTCVIIRNIDHFIEKIKDINLNEEVEILGILRIDQTKLGKKNKIPDYYIEVMDLKSVRYKSLNEDIIKTIRNKIDENPFYSDKLIDSIHPLTYLMDLLYPIKSLSVKSFITGGSWNYRSNIRDTLNSLYVGPKESFKSSIQRMLQKKVGARNMHRTEVTKQITYAGLFGTTERKMDKLHPDVRYGVNAVHSDNSLCFDEIEKLKAGLLEAIIRSKENGEYSILQDGLGIICEDKGSLILSQNCLINPDGSFNYDLNIFENLGWKQENAESLFDRLDLLYIIPKKDVFTAIMILRNKRREDSGEIEKEIADDLELDDYEFPNDVKRISEKIDIIHRNYFHKAKQLYRKTEIPNEINQILDNFYEAMLKSKENLYEGDDSFSMRGMNICKKSLRVLASLRLDDNVNEDDYKRFRDEMIQYVIPFRDSKYFKKENIDLNQAFKDVFETEIIEYDTDAININDLILRIKAFLKRRYFIEMGIEEFEERVVNVLGSEYNKKNYKIIRLLNNNKIWLESKQYNIISKPGRGNLTIIEKENNSNLGKSKEILSDNGVKKEI